MTKKQSSIFVVDDDVEDRELISEAFESIKYSGTLCFAADGMELMEKLSVHIPHIILLDLNMPRKDGREALREIRASEKLRSIPVIILTTSSSEEDINLSYYLGCNCYITKPGSITELVAAIESITNYWLSVYKLPTLAA